MLLILPVTPPASSSTTPFLLPFISKLYSPCLDLLLKLLLNFTLSDRSAAFDPFNHMPGNLVLPLAPVTPPVILLWFLQSLFQHVLLSHSLHPRFLGKPFFPPTLISAPSLWHHSYMFSNHFSADSSENLLSLPAFPFRLKCRPLAPMPFQCLADSSAQLKLSS